MTTELLVSPVAIEGSSGTRRVFDRAVVGLLRLTVRASRQWFSGRGVGLSCSIAARLISSDGDVRFRLHRGGRFVVGIDDRYWLEPLLVDGHYELEVDHFLTAVLRKGDVFIDCGANLGLWSVAAAQVIPEPDRVVSIEAGAATFERLMQNRHANGGSFVVLHRALSDTTGDVVSFFASETDAASSTLVAELSPDRARPESVTTIALPELLTARTGPAADRVTFVKLDVEGMEQVVMSAIDPSLHDDVVVVYEDHGRDAAHDVSTSLLQCGFAIAFLLDDGRVERIRPHDLARLSAALKTDRKRGYNLLATAPSGPAAGRLRQTCADLGLAFGEDRAAVAARPEPS